ncbi:MAG: hypothetical protein G3M70_08940 [Candidatus Nitronauta litoralis]|uniref:Sirohydrochlorin cobaltochelatase n=1 Tax=Candidatus Nitronauta litoralis TaxID=2705533 RepID=A0A7T0BW87_9BACT|nr:MAG: hypothetical protein G3M70_08940 [Candidatus Nitronauta litoralis]
MFSVKFLLTILVVWLCISQSALATQQQKIGFLLLAPDRGHLGNQEIENLFDEFRKDYTASLGYIGNESPGGPDRAYGPYINSSLDELIQMGVHKIVVIPLFLSRHHPNLAYAKNHIYKYHSLVSIEWAPAMAKSYLTAQIFLDRVKELSQNPENEQLILLGIGPENDVSLEKIEKELKPILDYAKRELPFKEIQTQLYFNYGAEKELRQRHNQLVDQEIIKAAAKKGDAILVPFVIGPRYSHQMSLRYWIREKFKEYDIKIADQGIIPHPNIQLWLRKTANARIDISPREVGVVVMPHGAQIPYNEAIEKVVGPLKEKYRIEMVYGMADALSLAEAVKTLEGEGYRKIIVVRMYSLEEQFRDQTEYILGLSEAPPKSRRRSSPPPQVRSGAVFVTFGGYEEDPLICQILMERVEAISQNPSKERVIFLAHGARSDSRDKAWRDLMEKHAEYIRKYTDTPFHSLHGLTVREDWPDKREKAIEEIRRLISQESGQIRTLVISNRLFGSGRYDEFLKGLKFDMNRSGLAPHVNLTRWLDRGIQQSLQSPQKLKGQAPGYVPGETAPDAG